MAIPLVYNVRNAVVRWQTNLLAVVAIALVVAVFIGLIALKDGFRIALSATGSPANGIMVQRGANSELQSGIGRDLAVRLIADDRIERDGNKKPMASPEIVVIANFPRKRDGAQTNVTVRGVTRQAFAVRTGLTFVKGRPFTPGLQEIVVGAKLADRFRNMDFGQSIRMQRREWKIVGIFTAEGSGFENEVWGDLNVMASAFNRTGGYQSITVRLADPRELARWQAELVRDPQLRVDLKQERAFYEQQAGSSGTLVMILAYFVAVVMGIGAVFAATNTMYATVAARGREIATLRALGFSRSAILISFVFESICLAVIAGILGCILSQAVNFLEYTSQGANFSQVAYAFKVTPSALRSGMIFAVTMGFVGGVLPAIRAARTPVSVALRGA